MGFGPDLHPADADDMAAFGPVQVFANQQAFLLHPLQQRAGFLSGARDVARMRDFVIESQQISKSLCKNWRRG